MTATPDLKYAERTDRSMRPSWSANRGYLNAEHEGIYQATRELPGWQEEGDSYKLYELGYFAGDVILEIGVYGGRSAVVELRGAVANPARARPPQFYGLDLDPAAIVRSHDTLQAAGLSEHALLYCGDLRHFVHDYVIRPTMVFVDGDHAYAGVRSDLDMLAEILCPGVPVFCHDYANDENDGGEYGVRTAVGEWETAGYAEFAGAFGCGALLVTTPRCRGPYSGLTADKFAEQRTMLLRNAGVLPESSSQVFALREELAVFRDLLDRSEADRAARLEVIQDLQRRFEEFVASSAEAARDFESERARLESAIKSLEAQVELMGTTKYAARRLVAAAARRAGLHGRTKRVR